jgi:hypothetical protein
MNATRFRSVTAALLGVAVAFGAVAPSSVSAQTRRVYRLTQIGLVDPQIFTPVGSNPCSGPLNILVNAVINMTLAACDPVTEGMMHPCTFDFNVLAVFDPFVTTPAGNPPVACMSGGQACELQFGVVSECSRQVANGPVSCNGDANTLVSTTYSNGNATATCLGGHPGTFGPGNSGGPTAPALVPVTGNASSNCGVSGVLNLTLALGDGLITIPLKGAQLGARYVSGNPSTLTTGLARGFLSETDADNIIIDVDQNGITINAPLSELLPGGTNNCLTAMPTPTPRDDRDRNPPGSLDGERGWWFYLSFTATEVTAPELVVPTPASTPTATSPPPTDTPVPTDTPLPTDTPIPTDTPLPTSTPIPTDTPPGAACPGDCNGNNTVPINEVQLTANVYLGLANLSACPAADTNNSNTVTIGEVVQASRSFQFDCP